MRRYRVLSFVAVLIPMVACSRDFRSSPSSSSTELSPLRQEALSGTALGNLAASMTPGQWSRLNTNNIGIISQWFSGFNTPIPSPAYDSSCFFWNPKKQKAYLVTASHNGGGAPYLNSPLFQYDDATNSWSRLADPAMNYPGTGDYGQGAAHCYDGVTMDETNEVLYWRPGGYGNSRIFRYCVNNTPAWCNGRQGIWSELPDATSTGGCYGVAIGIAYHATMDGGTLLCWDADGRGIVSYRENPNGGNGAWTPPLPGSNLVSEGGGTCLEYSAKKRVTVIGCQSSDRRFWKIDDNKQITQLQDSPTAFSMWSSTANVSLVTEPNTGNFIAIGGEAGNGMYELNPDCPSGVCWRTLDADLTDPDEICDYKGFYLAACSTQFYGVSIPTYGVLAYWKFIDANTGEFWVYKPTSTPEPLPPPSDTTPPTVQINSPIDGAVLQR
jgi:hypothetical protein